MQEKINFYNDPSISLLPVDAWEQAKRMTQQIKQYLAKVWKLSEDEISLSESKDSQHGDFFTNLAMQKAKSLGKAPQQIASDFVQILQADANFFNLFIKAEVAGPGFINLFMQQDFWLQHFAQKLSTDSHPAAKLLSGKKILFEYAHPNPFKSFHIGHLRNIILGESLIRILEEIGAEVIRVNYQGDVGMHIAKSIWGMLKLFKDEHTDQNQIAKLDHKSRVRFLGRAYALGAEAYNENDQFKAQIRDINALVYNAAQKKQKEIYPNWQPQTDYLKFTTTDLYDKDQIAKLWQIGKDWSLSYFNKNIYQRLGSSFVREYMESETMYQSEIQIKRAEEQGILKLSQGAIVFDGAKYQLDTRVFVNSLGLPTYEGKELGLGPLQFHDFGTLDLAIHNVAVEQISFFKVTFKVKSLLDPNIYAQKEYHNAYEFVGLKKGKMSSRTGNVVLAEDILDEARSKILNVLDQRDDNIEEQEKLDLSEKIGVAAVKYSFLNISPFSYLAFDLDLSLNFEGNSGPYLLYTYARANKVINEGQSAIKQVKEGIKYTEPEELELLKLLAKFEERIIDAAKTLSTNTISEYLFSLAQNFNQFYKKHTILKAQSVAVKNSRLALTFAVAKVLKKGLYLLGIETVNKM